MKDIRINQMKEFIAQRGSVSMMELNEAFAVSMITIRRDVNELLQCGVIEKIYGGVKYKERGNLVPFQEREVINIDAKRAIGQEAANILCDNDIVYIDSGTTTSCVIDYIGTKNITIVTTSLEVIQKAVEYDNIKLIVLTGIYNQKTKSFTGVDTTAALAKYNINKALMSASGVNIEEGVTHASPWEHEIKAEAVKKAPMVILMANSSKFDVVTLMTYCKLTDVNMVITDVLPPKKFCKYFEEMKIDMRIAKKVE